METMNVQEFKKKIKSGEAKVLTVEAARKLKGKRIEWMYFGYEGNEDSVQEMTVGEITTEYEFAKKDPMKGYSSRAEYWDSYMNERQKKEVRTTLMLLDEDGKNSFIRQFPYMDFYNEPTFTCSDADREVYYIVKDEQPVKEMYFLQKSENQGWWVVTDTKELVVLRFKEGDFNNTQKITYLNDSSVTRKEDVMKFARINREMAEWLFVNHRDLL